MYTGVSTEPTFTPYAAAAHLRPHTHSTPWHHRHHHFSARTTGRPCRPVVLVLIRPRVYALPALSHPPPQPLRSRSHPFSYFGMATLRSCSLAFATAISHSHPHICSRLLAVHCALHNPVRLPLSRHRTHNLALPPATSCPYPCLTPFSSLRLDSKAGSATSSKLQDRMSGWTGMRWAS